jgi:hypothetical protein
LDVLELILNKQRQQQQPEEGHSPQTLQGAKIVDLVTIFSCLTANFADKY